MTQVDHRAVGPGPSWGFVTGVGVLIGGALGFSSGVSGPVFVVVIGVGVAGGPTWGGILLMLAVLTVLGSGLVALARTLFGRTARTAGSVFFIALALAGGSFLGASVGNAADIAGWAPGPTPSPMPYGSFSPAPPTLEANATVTLALDGEAGFVPTVPEPMGDGRFGQWCYSDPGGLAVTEVGTGEVGRLAGYLVRVELRLTDPYGVFTEANLPMPRIVVTATDDKGVVAGLWSGQLVVAASEEASHTARFSTLQRDGSWPGAGLPATLSGGVTWACGSWQAT